MIAPQSVGGNGAHSVLLKTYTTEELLTVELKEPKLLLAPWLPEAGLIMIHAATGVGKTLFALGAALAIATGTKFLSFAAQEAHPVLYLDGEMPAYLMKQRVADALKRIGTPEKNLLRFYSWALENNPAPDLSTLEGQAMVDAIVGDAKVIFVDNLSAFCRSGKDNEAESWRLMDDWLLSHRRAGRAVVLIHHDGKSGKQRGTSKKEDKLDTIIQLVPPLDADKNVGAHFEAYFRKHRHFWGADTKPLEIQLGAEGWIFSEAKNQHLSLARAMRSNGASLRDIARETGLSKSALGRQL
jgi:putative DNA primase/helicase